MATSCSCLKICSVIVALSNICLGFFILVVGIHVIRDYLSDKEVPVGLIIVYFQISSFLLFAGMLLLIGIMKNKEKYISLYLLLSSLIWFVITMLTVSYMLFYNTAQMTYATRSNGTVVTTPAPPPTLEPPPKETVPLEKAVGFSMGLVLIWCGQLGVYKFHDQVIEKNVINAGQSYVNSALHAMD